MRTALLCSLLGLSLAGCGLFQVTVNGKVVRGPGSEEAQAADDTAATAQNGDGNSTTASASPKPAKLPARDVTLADAMPEPVVIEGKHTGEQMVPIKVVTKTPREISVVVLGGLAYERRHYGTRRIENVKVTPEEPLEFEVKSAEGPDPRPWHVVIADDKQTFFTGKNVVYGNPRAGATLEERELIQYSVLSSSFGKRLTGGQTQYSPEFAAELFTSVDERFFTWLTKERTCRNVTGPISAGEPLLLDSASGNLAHFRRANGERAECSLDDLELDVTTTRPAEVVMPPAVAPGWFKTNLWSDEEFLPLADQVPRIAAYKERKAKVSECWNREWDKHDPDGKAGDYDVIQYDSRGNVKKVESMTARILRKVDKVCKYTAIEKERDAIREQLQKEAKAENAKVLEAVAARFAK